MVELLTIKGHIEDKKNRGTLQYNRVYKLLFVCFTKNYLSL